MKPIFLILFGSSLVLAQPISFGVKGGLPLTEFIDTVSGPSTNITQKTHVYIVGPTVELRLPAGFGIELDALYRRFSYNANSNLVTALLNTRTTGADWEFPLMLKKRFASGPVRPFLAAGASFSKLSDLKTTVFSAAQAITGDRPAELKHDSSIGFVAGAGIDIHALILHITPEVRYTRWGREHFNATIGPGGTLSSNRNQAEFLVGITF